MKVTLSLPDDLHERLTQSLKGTRQTMEQLILDRLLQLDAVRPGHRYLLLHGTGLTTLERRVGRSLTTADEILAAFDKISSMHVGDHRLDLTPAQLLAVQQRAQKMNVSFDVYLKDVYERISVYLQDEL